MNFTSCRGYRLIVTIAALAWLCGCATSADPARMAVGPITADNDFPQPLRHSMCVRSVTGGEETNPLWVSKVDNDGFRSALAASMEKAGLIAAGDVCKYHVDANLLGLSQPIMGFDLEVTSHVNYKVYDSAGQPILLETISAPYNAKFSEAFAAVVRLQRANEGSIRASISQFLEKLRAVRLS